MSDRVLHKPRDYQLEAFEYAYLKKKCVCVLPTGTGKTLIGLLWAIRLLQEKKVKRILVLEPTRYLVEQIASYYRRIGKIDAKPIHGGFPKNYRRKMWKSRVIVATPEIVLSDLTESDLEEIDAIIVDECHHTTGQDAYAKLVNKIKAEYRLGLSAYIPPSRREEIEKSIGDIRFWSWKDPRIKQYVPEWIGEVYEAPLNSQEKDVLKYLEEIYSTVEDKYRSTVRLAIRFFVRDGALALSESIQKRGKMYKLLDGKLLEKLKYVRPAHKLPALKRILEDHEEFKKAIIFIDRVSLAYYISEKLNKWSYRNIVLCGKSRRERDVKEILYEAQNPETKIIVSTSAGEEGIDLPTADLLIIWSNIVSTLRFIQRHGRLLRKSGEKLKFVTYIVTPETPDVDSFVDAIFFAKKAGVDVPLEEHTLEALVKKSTKARIIELLEARPLPAEWIAEALNMSLSEAKRHLAFLVKNGDIIYFYTHLGKTYVAKNSFQSILEEYDYFFEPKIKESIADVNIVINKKKRKISGSLTEVLAKLKEIAHIKTISQATVSVQVFNPELKAYHLITVKYNYSIDTPMLAELIIRNAFSYAEKKIGLA
ncbi:MAG: DEAD/DEAH box helicase [Thermoprotei archaeon]|nr:MAG: DEAD/DEAH box helicase [Thermoprotei archaeon]